MLFHSFYIKYRVPLEDKTSKILKMRLKKIAQAPIGARAKISYAGERG